MLEISCRSTFTWT